MTTELYNMSSSRVNQDRFEQMIFDDANHLINILEQPENYDLLSVLLGKIDPYTGSFSLYSAEKIMTQEQKERWFTESCKADTHGHSGSSFAFVVARAIARIANALDVNGNLTYTNLIENNN